MPASLSALAMARVVCPGQRRHDRTHGFGERVDGRAFALSDLRIAELQTAGLSGLQSRALALGDALLFGYRGVDVHHERINTRPSSVTMKGTFCAMNPLVNATSWLSRSSLATITGRLGTTSIAELARSRDGGSELGVAV
jgi:hypothetical protein